MVRWALLLVAFVFIGCVTHTLPTGTPTSTTAGTPGPTPSPPATSNGSPPIDHPTGARDVVLRMTVAGGLPYPGDTVEEPARFTLYGDGHVIYLVLSQSSETAFELRHAQLSEGKMATQLEFALREGGLATAREHYTTFDEPIYDAGTTVFEINAVGFDKTVSVYALGWDGTNPDQDARARFLGLERELDYRDEVASGEATDLGAYRPEAYRLTLDNPFGPLIANTEWPWTNLDPATIALNSDGDRVGAITPEQAAELAVPPESAPDTIVATGPDGVDYLIRIRPLLPDELP